MTKTAHTVANLLLVVGNVPLDVHGLFSSQEPPEKLVHSILHHSIRKRDFIVGAATCYKFNSGNVCKGM